MSRRHITGNLRPLHHPHRRHVVISHLCVIRPHSHPRYLRSVRHSTNLSSTSLSPLPYQSKLEKCGQNASPAVFCQGLQVDQLEVNVIIVVFCASVYLIILGSCICSFVESRASRSYGKRRNKALSCITKIGERLGRNLPRSRIIFDILFILSFIGYFWQFRWSH